MLPKVGLGVEADQEGIPSLLSQIRKQRAKKPDQGNALEYMRR